MTDLARTCRVYDAAASIQRNGVELFAVGDPSGAELNAAIRQLLLAARDEGIELWGDVLLAAKALRWRLITQPQPLALNDAVVEGLLSVRFEVERLRRGVGGDGARLLDALERSVDHIGAGDPPPGAVLLRCIEEVGRVCVVVCENQRAASGVGPWLFELGVSVITPAALRQTQELDLSQAYVIGPPCLYGPALITAPPTAELTFLVPAWFADRSAPHTLLAPLASGAIRVSVTVREEGDLSTPPQSDVEIDDELRPLPVWTTSPSDGRTPGPDEVLVHKVLLGGGRAIYLDEAGERIRTLDPHQPTGERVMQSDVANVRPGTYLVLREGQTEPRVLYDRAMALLGGRAAATEAAQQHWKSVLRARLDRLGPAAVERGLAQFGVRRAARAREWIEPMVARPQRHEDFEGLLRWLDVPVQPTFNLATNLRRLRLQASADIREQLECAVSEADLSTLERDGFVRIDLDESGLRGMIAARVLAISPQTVVIPRHEARLPFSDRSAQWLE